MKKVTSFLVMLVILGVPMHVLSAQTTETNGMDVNPDLITFLMGVSDTGGDYTDDSFPMGDGLFGGGMMNGGTMGGGMMNGGSKMGHIDSDQMGCGMMHGSGMMHGIRMYVLFMQMKNALELTPDQIGKMQSQILDYIRTVAPIEANIKIAKAEAVSQLLPLLETQGPGLDLNAVDQKIRQIQKLRGDMQVDTIRLIVGLKGVFTTDQLKKLQNIMFSMVTRMHGGFGYGPWSKRMPGTGGSPQQQPVPEQNQQQQGAGPSGM